MSPVIVNDQTHTQKLHNSNIYLIEKYEDFVFFIGLKSRKNCQKSNIVFRFFSIYVYTFESYMKRKIPTPLKDVNRLYIDKAQLV